MNYFILTIITLATALWLKIRAELSLRRRRNGLPYPPGPRRLPVIGNTFQLPTSYEWLQAAEWKKDYGMHTIISIISLK